MDITGVDCVEQAAIRERVIDRWGESSPLRQPLDRDVREKTNGASNTFSFTIIYTTQYYKAKENIFGWILNTCEQVNARCMSFLSAANSASCNGTGHFSERFSLCLVSLQTTRSSRGGVFTHRVVLISLTQ